jgi:TolB-like protein
MLKLKKAAILASLLGAVSPVLAQEAAFAQVQPQGKVPTVLVLPFAIEGQGRNNLWVADALFENFNTYLNRNKRLR